MGDDEYLVSCRRYYSTGSIYADCLVLPLPLGDVQRTVLIESDRPGVTVPDDWGGFGQRLTGSGSIALDRVLITRADFIERPVIDKERPRYPFTFNQVHLTRRETSTCLLRRRSPRAGPRSPSRRWPSTSSTR